MMSLISKINNKLCVVWPGNEAMFSLDVLETSVTMTSIIAPPSLHAKVSRLVRLVLVPDPTKPSVDSFQYHAQGTFKT